MSNRDRKPGNKIPHPEGSAGQNPFWPGEDAQEAGEIKDAGKDEITTIPFVDSVAHKKNTKT